MGWDWDWEFMYLSAGHEMIDQIHCPWPMKEEDLLQGPGNAGGGKIGSGNCEAGDVCLGIVEGRRGRDWFLVLSRKIKSQSI